MNRDYTGKNFDPNRCASSATYGGRWSSTVQCSRKPQPGGRYCKQHDPDKIKDVEAIKSEVYDASSAVWVAKHRVLAAALEEELDTTKLTEARKLYLEARSRQQLAIEAAREANVKYPRHYTET